MLKSKVFLSRHFEYANHLSFLAMSLSTKLGRAAQVKWTKQS